MSTTALIDTHCHLDFEVFDNDRPLVLQRASDNNINTIVIPGTEKIYWERIKKLCAQYESLHACYGLHPYWINSHEKKDLQHLNAYIESNHPIAIGECGLDFRPHQADKKTQQYFFEAELDIAESKQLPVVIHSVKATETVIKTIKQYTKLSGMIHSYSGSYEQALQLIELDFFISVGGSTTYYNAKRIQAIIKKIPLDRLLVETDAPDQPDQLNKGKRNEPAYLINTVKKISQLKQIPVAKIAQQTTINAKHLFRL
ncbi:MAG: TatD family hydrolase [Gammaproteobacteria bacterium]|nr:TatD family hydrolase [Gammaproteobacteria bacterium]